LATRHLTLEQKRSKQRRYRDNKYWRSVNESRLTPEVVDQLLDMPHPNETEDWQSMYSYVLELNKTGQTYKVKQILDAISS